jgi:chaperone required for assembly of F1-ATPase
MSIGRIDLLQVTLYSLYATQRDFIEARGESTIGVILQHLAGDYVLYPDADPALAATQLAAWAPMLACWRNLGVEVPIAKPLQTAQIPWEVAETLQTQLAAMSPAQLAVVVQAMTNLGSVTLGLCLAQGAITVEQAVAALSVTSRQATRDAADGGTHPDPLAAEMGHTVKRLWQYAQLSR